MGRIQIRENLTKQNNKTTPQHGASRHGKKQQQKQNHQTHY
jgi:hypothetical protein